MSTVGGAFLKSFITYALLEEAAKYFFAYRLIKRNPKLGMKETILYAGVVGLGFGFTEKLLQDTPSPESYKFIGAAVLLCSIVLNIAVYIVALYKIKKISEPKDINE